MVDLPGQDDIEKQVAAFFQHAVCGCRQPVAPTAHFVNDLGGDSLQMLSVMLVKIEEASRVLLTEDEIAGCTCARDVARVIRARLHGDLPARPAPRRAR